MRIKSYFANRVHDALAAAQSELGPNAVLLSSHKTMGEARSLGLFEVVCGLADNDQPEQLGRRGLARSIPPEKSLTPPETPVVRSPPTSATRIRRVDWDKQPALGEDASFESALRTWLDLRNFLVSVGFSATPAEGIVRDTCADVLGESGRLGDLLECGGLKTRAVTLRHAERFRGEVSSILALLEGAGIEEVPRPLMPWRQSQWLRRLPPPDELKGSLLRNIAARLQEEMHPINSGVPVSRALVLVGPPGSGKTTTTAKIAALTTIASHRPVRIVGIGAKVAGSVARLGALADVLNLPCEMVFSPDQLAIATTPADPDELLIVDCPGFSVRDPAESQQWADAFSAAGLEDVNLVLPAYVRPAQMFEAAARYQMFRPRSLTFTHVDATDDITPCLALAVSKQLPVRYLCDGQEIPEDLAVPSNVEIAQQLLPDRAVGANWN